MSTSFTKLFSSITESTVWCEPDRVRLTWICMLAMADRYGRVWGSIPGIANRARVPLEDAEDAINRFLSPDKYSRTPEHDGRRIEPIDGGWRLLNYAKYRETLDEESVRESKRKSANERRAREREELYKNPVEESEVEEVIYNRHKQKQKQIDISSSLRSEDKRVRALTVDELAKDGLTEQTAAEFLAHRKRFKAPLTSRAWSGIKAQASKAGWSAEQAVCKALERGWRSFEAEWVQGDRQQRAPSWSEQQAAQMDALTGRKRTTAQPQLPSGDVIDV